MNVYVKIIAGIFILYLCFFNEEAWGQNHKLHMDQDVESNIILVKYDPEYAEIVDEVKSLLNVKILERYDLSGIEVWQVDGDLETALRLVRTIPGALAVPNYVVELERPVEMRPFEPKDEIEKEPEDLSFAVDKGGIIISGTGNYKSHGGDYFEDLDGQRAAEIRLTSMVNYFVFANLSFGVAVDYRRESQGDFKSGMIGIGPAVGYYFGDSGSKSFPYLSGGVRYYGIGNGSSITGSEIIMSAGIIFSVNKHVGFVVEASYHSMNLKGKDWNASESGNMIMIGIGLAGLFY